MSEIIAKDRSAYYGIVSNLFSGVLFLWALPVLGPTDNGIAGGVTGNLLIDFVIFIVVSCVLGCVLEFLARYSVQPLLKKVFWKGKFFSDIFLVGAYRLSTKEELARYADFAETNLGFQKEDLSVLIDPEVVTDETKEKKAIELSSAIYHSIDEKVQGTSLGKRAYLQAVLYSFFRNISLSFLVLAVADLIAILSGHMGFKGTAILLILFNLAIAVVFLILARERGERHVRSLFWVSL